MGAGQASGSGSPRVRWRWAWAVPVVTLAAGALFGTSASVAQVSGDLRNDPQDLSSLIQARAAQNERDAERVRRLQAEIEAESDGKAPSRLTRLRTASERLEPGTGLAEVRGPAVQVTLDDAYRTLDSLPEGFDGNDVVVHQEDVQGVVNALWAGGAEAMQIMDQRVISTSAVRCVGNTLILQGRVYSPPFTITAVGDVEGMKASLEGDAQVKIYKEYVDAVGLGYEQQEIRSVTLPAFAGALSLGHVTSLPKPTRSPSATGAPPQGQASGTSGQGEAGAGVSTAEASGAPQPAPTGAAPDAVPGAVPYTPAP